MTILIKIPKNGWTPLTKNLSYLYFMK